MEALLKEIKESLNELKLHKDDLVNIEQEKERKIEESKVIQKDIQAMQNGDMRKVIKENEFNKIKEELNELEKTYKDKKDTAENVFKEKKEKIKESVAERLNSFKFRADVDKIKKEIEKKKEQKEEQENEIAKLNKKVEELFEKQKNGDSSEIWRIQNLQSYIERHYNIRNELKEELEKEEQKLSGYIIFEDNQEEYSVLKNIEEQIGKSTLDNIDKISFDIDAAQQTGAAQQGKATSTVQKTPVTQPKQNSTVNQPKPATQPVQSAPNSNPVKNQKTKTKQDDIKDSTKILISIDEQGLLYNYIKDGEVRDEKALGIIECANQILRHEYDDCFLRNFVAKSVKGIDKIKDDPIAYDDLMKDIVTYDMAGAEKSGFRARRQLRKLIKRFEKAGFKVINRECAKFSFKTDILKGLSNFFKGSKKRIAGKTKKQAMLDRHHSNSNDQGGKVSNNSRNDNFVAKNYSTQRDELLESEIIQNAIRKAKQKIDNDKKQAKMQNLNSNNDMQK